MARKPAARPKLGRGLAALLGDTAPRSLSTNTEGNKSEKGEDAQLAAPSNVLPVEVLAPGPFQPRQEMEPEALQELAESIRARGILQPILVRPNPDKEGYYQIIAGERRWRAAQLAQCHTVPVHIRDLDEADAMAAALVENLQRADLNPIEEAEGFSRLMEDYSLTQDELAVAIGKSRPHVANTLRLLRLPDSVRKAVGSGALSAGHARALLGHPDPVAAAHDVLTKGLSVRQTEALVQAASENKGKAGKTAATKKAKDPEIAALERELASRLGLKVKVNFDGRKGGFLEIHYKSLDQLDDVLLRLKS
ncbi:chromosome partitioning protein ParB [Acetobacter cibinongensis]|uniref:Chromosome partitioning nuclease protein ParB n=1 Tax=Acetobacter cibinongensis TaxID=146475 RepID=A0A0D6N5S5_9PROT|nr:ParB/RepB/Spo0J family partition protein [Acetobacter cibinongensis]GAN60923.1 chromosome partitioning nuclease protein ParB [Acetobacter cibinongensis]GBQ13243.1 chromosome partitioning protein ParB [Acetobacter cibinongensis NRIC 0482]GEL58580.1 chromosome partitioning protein ParB [Acetobacter cibinongensis]